MFEETAIKQDKARLMVRLCLTDGTEVEGELWCAQGERLADVLNDDRAFLPIGEGDAVRCIAKSVIATAEPLGAAPREASDPYAVLRIQRTATDDEVRAAWMNRMKASHPDRLASLGLDETVVYAARRACQRINAAHDEVMRTRRAAA